MKANEYQIEASRTGGGKRLTPEMRLAVAAIGLTGEAGETVDHIKKYLAHGHELDLVKLQEEIGDVCWYIAELCNCLDLNLDLVLSNNITKLQQRYPQGFTPADSINRKV